jgi:hypothetical protein
MISSPDEQDFQARASGLELPLLALEERLAALGLALQGSDADAVDRAGAELHGALAAAVEHFHRAAREGSVPVALRRRLAEAGARVAAQREALARGTAALDRAIDVLMPRGTPRMVYSSGGGVERGHPSGGLLA